MEVLNDLPSHKPFAIFDYPEPSPRLRSGDIKESSWQPPPYIQGMEPYMPSIKTSATGLSEASNRPMSSAVVSRTNEMTSWEFPRHHLFVDDKDRTLAGSVDSKNSKIGWKFSANETMSKGHSGLHHSSPYVNNFNLGYAADEAFLQNGTSPASSNEDVFKLPCPNSTLSPMNACSDGSSSSGAVVSSEGCQLDQFMDYVFDKNGVMDYQMESFDEPWFPESVEFAYSYPMGSDHATNTSKSANSSDGSNDEGMPHSKQEDHMSYRVQNELEASSHDSATQMQSILDTGLWQKQKRADGGLEEIFSPKSVGQPGIFSGSQICFGGTNNTQLVSTNAFRYQVPMQDRYSDNSVVSFNSKPSQSTKLNNWQIGVKMSEGSILDFSNYSKEAEGNLNRSSNSNQILAQSNTKLVKVNGTIQIHQDTTREFGLNPILGSPLKSAKSESEYSEICLVHLLIAGAEAVATRDMDLASVILVRLKELVSCSGSTMQRVAAYFSEALQSRIDGSQVSGHVGYSKDPNEILAAFQILHEISPYIKFGHFTANQAILEVVEGEKNVHIVDFEIMEGIQWPPLMQALASRKGGPPQLKITALFRSKAEQSSGLSSIEETGKRLSEFAQSLNIPFSFTPLGINSDEEASLSNFKLTKGEALVVNCMVHLPHMPHRTASTVSAFLHGMRKYSPVVLTLVEEELGRSASPVASYFFEALHHYSAICHSLEVCLSSETRARMLVERVFLAPRINSTVQFWGGGAAHAQPEVGGELPRYNWSSLARSAGFKSLPLSFQNVSQAKLLLGLYKEGFKLDPISNRLLLGWRGRPLFAASVWN